MYKCSIENIFTQSTISVHKTLTVPWQVDLRNIISIVSKEFMLEV